jgi:capsular exopolysaccharide synthesis family protein
MSELVTLSAPRSGVAEAYRSLRTNLAFARPDAPLATLLVTSPGADEDRSGTLANLAVVVAQGGRRVVVVDADLRRPSQHTLFGLPNTVGLTSALVDDAALADLPLQATGVEGLEVLTSGPTPPNPAELLAARRMRAVVERLIERADLVLFDSPPLVPVTDAAVLARLVDGVLLVLAAGRSRRDQVTRAREVLDKVGATVLGVVLTDVAPDATAYGYYGAEAR